MTTPRQHRNAVKDSGSSAEKLNPSGAPLLPNLLRYQAFAVCYTAARLLPCIFGKRGACRFYVSFFNDRLDSS